MNKKKIAVLLSFILTVCSLGPAAIPSRALAAEAAALSENAVEANEYDGGERTGDDVLKETVSLNGETGTVSEDVPEAAVSDESCEGAARELIQRLEEKGMTRNSGGWYEYTDENGETWSYDPEDPETYKYFMEDDEEGAAETAIIDEAAREIHEDAVADDSLMAMGGTVHDDPYQLWLDSRYYRYPKYYRESDKDKRVGIRYGIDVSKHQKVISESSWRKLKDDYDIEFAFIRAGYRGYGSSGTLNKDECFRENLENAYDAGLAVGVYYFSQAISRSEAREEAKHCMDIVDSYSDKITLPLVIDYEYSGDPGRLKAAGLSASAHTEIVNAFCEEVEDEGYSSMVYANKSMLENDMDVDDIDSDHLIWLANYVSADSGGVYSTSYSDRLSCWQYTSKYSGFGGLVGSSTVDMNFWYGAYPDEGCKVTFNTNGGSKVSSQTVGKGDKVKRPKDPTKKGHTFIGWYKDSKFTKEWDFDKDTVKKDTTIYARWQVNTYTVTFVTVSECEIEPIRVDYGKKIKEPVITVKPGYSVVGWYLDSAFKKKWDFSKDTVQGDMTLYSLIRANAVQITYHHNGGWGTVAPTKGRVDETVTVAENKFTRQGYTYINWNTSSDGRGTWYKAGDSFLLTPSANELYAIWDPEIYTVTFEFGRTVEVIREDKAPVDPVPEKTVSDNTVSGNTVSGDSISGNSISGNTISVNTVPDNTAAESTSAKQKISANTVSDNVPCDGLAAEPEITVSGDYVIEGWYQEKEYQNRWDFAINRVRRNLTLYARWVPADAGRDWGDLDKEENAGARALYKDPSEIPEGLWEYGIEDKTYTGNAITQNIKVFYGKKQLVPGSEYDLKYTGNTDAGLASVTISGKGNYSGSDEKRFEIVPVSLSGNDIISAPDISLAYNGSVQKGTTSVAVRLGNKNVSLKAGTDFDYSYPETENDAYTGKAGSAATTDGRGYEEYIVKITGKGNYTGEAEFTERIYATDKGGAVPVKKLAISRIPAQTLEYDSEGKVKPVLPAVTVKDGSTELKPVSDNSAADGYSLVYRNNRTAGKASVLIVGHGRYIGSKAVNFTIKGLPISKAAVQIGGRTVKTMTAREYTGKEIRQEDYRLVYSGNELKEGRDYSVSYSNNINAGKKATVLFTGEGIYTGKLKKTFTINRIPLENNKNGGRISVDMERSTTHKKGGAAPFIQVIYKDASGERILAEGRDYTLKYSNNKAVNDASNTKKMPTVQITGKGNYSGKLKENFRITAANIGACTMTAADIIYASKANICKPAVQICDTDGKKLKAGTDYDKNITCRYRKETEITRRGSRLTVSADTVVDKADVIPLGAEITASAKGKGNYAGSRAETVFRFVSYDISKADVKIADKVYTGKPVTLEKEDIISVTLKNGSAGKEDVEIVPGSYVNNINKGTAKVTVRGTGRYGGMRTVSFRIVSRPVK